MQDAPTRLGEGIVDLPYFRGWYEFPPRCVACFDPAAEWRMERRHFSVSDGTYTVYPALALKLPLCARHAAELDAEHDLGDVGVRLAIRGQVGSHGLAGGELEFRFDEIGYARPFAEANAHRLTEGLVTDGTVLETMNRFAELLDELGHPGASCALAADSIRASLRSPGMLAPVEWIQYVALGTLTPDSVEPLLGLLDHDDWPNARQFGAAALAYTGDERGVAAAIRCAQSDPDSYVRAEVVKALGEFQPGRPEVVAALEAARSDPKGGVRRAAERALKASARGAGEGA
jgi:hypothetical protein